MSLTNQESNIVKLIGVGYSDKEVANVLNIATTTAVKHKQNIMQKLGVSKATELVVYYWCKKSNIDFDLSELRKQAITVMFFGITMTTIFNTDFDLLRAKRSRSAKSKTKRESII